ncbi:FAD-dependent oxidoreductase [uncultured Draconibacterium sp.]|uniref:NAD(P)/FAD-dependent oxidoreductase n=1 Tax=uncultured Draconibacterium sp. TaxID=1573823 RepID=UPI0025DF1460|nr:FAD-dependent oxidoreductase [uncultured Draconibacterium sp.]
MKHFLVLGGGFAGVEAAIKLQKKGYKVTLVSDRDYLFIYPISIWIPVKGISFEDSKMPLARLQKKHGFGLVIDSVKSIDVNSKTVKLAGGELSYDYLFIALGMHKVNAKGAENTLSICGQPEQAVSIGNELEKLVQAGKGKIAVGFGGNPKDSKGSAVRGGPAFELLFNISTYLKKKDLLNNFELNFFAPMPEPGKRMGAKAVQNMKKFYKHYGIKEHVGTKITGFTKNEIEFEGGKKLESDLIVFIAGGSGHSVLKDSGLPLSEAGFVKTLPTCQVEGFPEVYAIGDSAELLGPAWGAKQGHMAEIMADVAAYNADQQIKGTGKTKSYVDKVSIICVMDSGDGAAWVERTAKKETMMMLPIVGHWLKKGWGFYYKNSKLKNIPRIPGM